jgi:hypothetical protein
MNERTRCLRCGDVIGVYERMVVLADGVPRETSLLNEPIRPVGECYHHACFPEQLPATRPGG